LLNLALLVTCWVVGQSSATEMEIELKDNAVQCFYEQIEKGQRCFLEYQVTRGGNFDVDVALFGPGDRVIYQKQRKQYDSVDFTTTESGEHYFCFSNEFSSFTHKVVYFDFATGSEPPITDEIGKTHKAFTQFEVSVMKIHEALTLVRDYQTHHRLRESKGRDTAEYLNERVQYWSLGESILLVVVGLCQVFVLRRFFANKRSQI
jgi:protein ERP2